jgi:HSP20 family protein
MALTQALEVQEKKELVSQQEKTVPARYYVPQTDIFENDDALVVVMEVPGVAKKDLDINLENDTVQIEAHIDQSNYEGLEPLYAEYNIGHFARTFALSDKIDRDGITAELDNGVLTLTLKKAKAIRRSIAIG